MRKKSTVLLSFVLMVCMLASSAAFATGTDAPSLPLVEPGTVTLRFTCPENPYPPESMNKNLPIYQEFEKLTGVTIQWDALPNEDFHQVLSTRLMAAVDLPDIFIIPSGTTGPDLGEKGLLIDLIPLIEENAFYLSRLMEMNPRIRKSITDSEGHIWGYPSGGEGNIFFPEDMETGVMSGEGTNINQTVAAIRKDWLDKLGLEVPETLDDWYEVLTAFKTQDPNGNGLADEIPFTTLWGPRNVLRFVEAYGLPMAGYAGSTWEIGEDGTAFYKPIDPRYKDGLAYINKLYSEGLIDLDYVASDYYGKVEKINRNIVGAQGSDWMSNFLSWNANLRQGGVVDANWVPVKPLKTVEGEETPIYSSFSASITTAISSACKTPEIALQWIDFATCSPQGLILMNFGVEGVSYTVDASGTRQYTDYILNNPNGLGPFEALRALGAYPYIGYFQTTDSNIGLNAEEPSFIEFIESFTEFKASFPSLTYTVDERAIIAEIDSIITPLVTERMCDFIEGRKSIDEFDDYVQELKGFGLDQLTEIVNAALARYNAQ